MLTSRLVFYLGRAAVDDFSELLILAGSGYGIGAYKILRSLYEKVVTAAFIAKNPAEARLFAVDDAVKKWRLWTALLEADPSAAETVPKEQIERLKAENDAARQRRKDSVCSKCGQPKTQEAWTRADLLTMARKTDPLLASLYCLAYLQATFHSHATAFGLSTRLNDTASFRETSPKEARMALQLGHNLILYLINLQNEYFGLGLSDNLQERFKAFLQIWGETTP